MAVTKLKQITRESSLEFGTFHFFEDYVVSTIKEGVDLDEEKLLQFYSLCDDVFEGRAFSVVELKAFSFSIDPTFYIKYSYLLSNVKAHAMVIDQNTLLKLNQCEVLCIKHCPCKTFYDIEEAVSWIYSV